MASPHTVDNKSDIYHMAMLLAANMAMPYYDLPSPSFVTDPHKKDDEDEEAEQPIEPDSPEPIPGSPV